MKDGLIINKSIYCEPDGGYNTEVLIKFNAEIKDKELDIGDIFELKKMPTRLEVFCSECKNKYEFGHNFCPKCGNKRKLLNSN